MVTHFIYLINIHKSKRKKTFHKNLVAKSSAILLFVCLFQLNTRCGLCTRRDYIIMREILIFLVKFAFFIARPIATTQTVAPSPCIQIVWTVSALESAGNVYVNGSENVTCISLCSVWKRFLYVCTRARTHGSTISLYLQSHRAKRVTSHTKGAQTHQHGYRRESLCGHVLILAHQFVHKL